MKEVKEIGKVISEVDWEDFKASVKRKAIIEGQEYNIIPIRFGEMVEITDNIEEDKETVSAKLKQALLKEAEKYIESIVIDDIAINNRICLKETLYILSENDFRGGKDD